jgi:hypothetical protein
MFMVLAQLRHVRAAEWSGEAAIKDQQNMLFLLELGEADHISLIILQDKVRCRRI